MTRPEEPTEALPTRAVPPPVDPGATVDLDRTMTVGGAEPTARFAATDATVHLGSPDQTVHLGGPDATVHLGSPDATVHLGGPGGAAGTPDATVHLGGPGADATTRFAGGHTGGPTLGAPGGVEPTTYAAGAYTTNPTVAAPGGYGGPTGAYPSAGTSAASGPGRPGTGGDLRFGPGVPATPPAAPAWPTMARPPRPLWRKVVSVLSSLLTLALVVVVGLYLWQRLRPLEVEGVTVAVPRPAGERCDVTVDVVATVRTNGRGGVIRYQWMRTDAPPGALLTERVGEGQRTATLTLKWTFSGVGKTTETATVNIIEPSPVQAGTQVVYHCRG